VTLSNCSISDELRNMFALSKPTVVFCTDKSQKNVLKVVNEFTFVKTVISFDDAVDQENEILQYSDLIKNSVSFQVEEDVDLEDQVALILNSSGTTGLPKGVMFTYKMLRTNLVHARSGKCWRSVEISFESFQRSRCALHETERSRSCSSSDASCLWSGDHERRPLLGRHPRYF
jgi:long-subunit acyl-CoA synthetase (AMP-forming)